MKLESFIGSENIKQSLLASIHAGRLAHGLIIFGKKGYGVNYFAKLLACEIIGKDEETHRLIFANSSPLVQIIQGEGTSGQIKVDRIRQINNNVNFSSLSGEKRVVIIENCENFNQNSANALLKNLEEPKDDITYILTSCDSSNLLATIRSRCGLYTLFPPSEKQALDYLKNYSEDKNLATVTKIYSGNIGLIQNALDNPLRLEILKKALAAQEMILKKDRYSLAKLISDFNKKKEDFIFFLEDLEYILKKDMTEKTVSILNKIVNCKKDLSKNANLLLVLENFVCEV